MTAPELPEAWLASIALAPARWQTMWVGARRFDAWLEDLVLFGLATLEPDPLASLEPLAATLTDDQLPSAAQWARAWVSRIGARADWAEELAAEMGHWHLLNRMLIGAETLGREKFAGLLLHYGHRVQAARLPELGRLVLDDWCCTGIREGNDGPLNFRHTQLRGSEPDHQLTLTTFAYGTALPPTQLSIGDGGRFRMRVYPGGLPGRGAWPQPEDNPDVSPRLSPATEAPHAFESWSAQQQYHRALILRQPWRQTLPIAVSNLRVRFGAGGLRHAPQVTLVDSAGDVVRWAEVPRVPGRSTGELVAPEVWQLLAVVGEAPFTLYGELDRGEVRAWSAWADGRLQQL